MSFLAFLFAFGYYNNMTTLQLQKKIAPLLPKGKDNFKHFIKNALLLQLQETNRKITAFEARYNRNFSEFEHDWKEKKVTKQYSYEHESNYLDWQALEAYKRDLMQAIYSL